MAKWVGTSVAWHQRSSWAQPPGTGTAIKPSCCFPDQSGKTVIQQANTVDIGTFAVFLTNSCLVTRSFSLSFRAGTVLAISLCFLLTGTLPKPCSSATSVLNEFFKICQNFVDHRMTLHCFQNF